MLSSRGEEGILFLRLWPPSKRRGWGQDHRRRSLRAALGLTPPAFAPRASGARSWEQHITLHSPAQLNQEAKQPGSYIPGALCLQFICSEGAVGLAAAPVAFG